ncbi:hypothetical protein NEMBOFW57_009283 [Staphylotrichum longicolle]|uniref:Uncharacterized protein n=1 Tax=Staphylotrichum longicolle TaxID=669026 RepID=A0AAD4HTC1_9PEZI|nr:hypothetical protein NEMBOFW57_009283 [Staphylotrichum longicolle]
MKSWNGYNYYTTDPQKWVQLMNLSTAEWNIGPLPPNVVAIPGPLNSSYNFPAGVLVIENASRTTFGSRDIENVIFGATAGLVPLWALPWFGYHWWQGTLLNPKGSAHHDEEPDDGGGYPRDASPSGTTVFGSGGGGGGFMPADRFREELDAIYEDVRTELELYERTIQVDGVSAEDVEGGTELLRKLYETRLKIWASQNALEYSNEEWDLWLDQCDALMAGLKSLVDSWNTRQNLAGWSPEEQNEIAQLAEMLKRVSY